MAPYFAKVMLRSFLLTEAVELGLAAACRHRGRELFVVALANLLTNPLYVFLVLYLRMRMMPQRLFQLQVVMECVIILVEGLLHAGFWRKKKQGSVTRIRPFVFSLAANLASIAAGDMVSRALH